MFAAILEFHVELRQTYLLQFLFLTIAANEIGVQVCGKQSMTYSFSNVFVIMFLGRQNQLITKRKCTSPFTTCARYA